jgi:hypothetical protein
MNDSDRSGNDLSPCRPDPANPLTLLFIKRVTINSSVSVSSGFTPAF